jgi:phage regulator Rha-like protein
MADNQTKKITVQENKKLPEISEDAIKYLIYEFRGQQVMLDSDLAMLYQVETKVFNQAVKRNIERFPENYRFQLTKEEFDSLRSQNVTSNGKGGRRYMPYVFTEQGIAMLSAVLRSDVAVQISIKIMNTFVEMRRFLMNNSLMFERINEIEVKQLAFQKSADERFDEIFNYISEHEESSQKIFFDGQIYDAFSLLVELVSKADKKLVLVDNYVDVGTLNILAKKKTDVEAIVYTVRRTRLSERDVNNFNQQYPTLKVKYTGVFHDRFLILDDICAYHIGASLKDAGKKCFGISLIEDTRIVNDILERLELESEEED